MKQSTVNVRGIVSWVKHVRRLILTSLTRLLNGSDAATEEGLFTGAREQLWPGALPAATSDSCGYQQELNQARRATAALFLG